MKTSATYRKSARLYSLPIFIMLILAISPSCTTGIESTKPIRMTKEDVKLMAKSPEQVLAESIHGTPLSRWEKGKEFLALSDRTSYIFEPNGFEDNHGESSLKGKTLRYVGLESRINPDLKEECVILFSDGFNILRYRTGKPTESALKDLDSSRMPLISDIALIDQWKRKLQGARLWTKSNIWYDEKGDRTAGLKYVEVTIDDIVPATGDFPISLYISGPDDIKGLLHMNYTADPHDSRNFAAIFSMRDPKERYPNISSEMWTLIQRARVGEGMTKEECKLAIGNPDEVRSGHNRAQTMDIWQYSDGTYLVFTDGLLTNFRQ